MSSSPFKSTSQLSTRPKNAPLSLSQALLITAGLAGLVGLSSGIIIRFSLSHSASSNARFLSPLQTFPALPNWTPNLPDGGTAAPSSLPDGTDTQRANGAETNSTGTQGTETQSGRSYTEPEPSPATTLDPFVEQNQNNDLYTRPSAEEEASVYPETSYPEDSSPQAPSAEDEYPQNYPTIEAPASGETPYYPRGQQ